MQMLVLAGATWCAASVPLCFVVGQLLHRVIAAAENREALRLLDVAGWSAG